MDEYDQVIQTLPSWLARPLLELPSTLAPQVQEVRLRVGCTPMFTVRGAVYAPQELGREGKALQTLRLTPPQMEEILFTLCGGSVHTHQTEIAQGYVTLASGCRAGLGGQFLQTAEQGIVLQELTSVNLRIAREKMIDLPEELRAALQEHFIGMLLVGEPGSGKTTVLRSMAQELARQKKLVSVIDERRELFAGMPRRTFPGEALDVISGIPKGQAVQMALRTLSPQVLLLDELGGMEEVSALEQGMFSGVDFVATLHAATPEEAVGRPQVRALQARGAVKVLVWLQGRTAPGQIREVRFL
ncbi:ATPase, T2SS/T4P/T4SS family [Faecalibacterium hattorii]|uniref:ATPase, T2SS/T4P/T4SS family n=1 Tax=Faecalibacterium hattorii TaxID=2935520 RepID=UPI003AAEA22C